MTELFVSRKSQKGFTLIEFVLYISILSIMLLAVSNLFVGLNSIKVKSDVSKQVMDEGTQVMLTITQIIRNSDTVTAPIAGVSGTSLTLTNINSAVSPTVIDLNNGRIRVKDGASAAVDISSNQVVISNLTFQNVSKLNSPGSIKIQFTVSGTNNQREFSYQQTFYGTGSLD